MKKLFAQVAALSVIAIMLAAVVPVRTEAAGTLPQPVLRMFDELATVSSFRDDATLSARITSDGVTVDVNLAFDVVSDTKEKSEINFVLSASSASAKFRDAVGASSIKAKGSVRVLSSKKVYVYFDELPEFKNAGIDLNKVEKRWIDLSSKEYSQYVQMGEKESFPESIERMKNAYINHPAFTFTEQGSTATAYRYQITLNPAHLQGFLAAIQSDEVAVADLSASTFFSNIRNWNASLTIDKSTYLPKVASATLTAGESVNRTAFSITMSLENKYSAFNQKVSIKKPSKAITLEKLMKEFTSSLTGSREKGSDASKKSYVHTVRTLAELYYDSNGNSYLGVCKDSEVRSALKSAGNAACFAKAQEYAVSAKLTKGYYCADSTGLVATLSKKGISSKDFSCE